MSSTSTPAPLDFYRIVVPTDFSENSHIAFEHALALALGANSSLDILHVDTKDDGKDEWQQFPAVRKTLANWGVDEAVLRGTDAEGHHVNVRKSEVKDHFAGSATVSYIDQKEFDLVVMATHGRTGLGEWFTGSISGKVVRDANRPCLLFGPEARGFLTQNGKVSLNTLLVPTAEKPDPQVAVDKACIWGDAFGNSNTRIKTLHVSDDDGAPSVSLPQGWQGRHDALLSDGDVPGAICEAAMAAEADLIVICTEGHNSYLDILTGNITERVVKEAPCPVLAVPAPTYG